MVAFRKHTAERQELPVTPLSNNSRGLRLVSHETFTSTEDVIEKEIDVHSDTVIREVSAQRERVIDTETGRQLKEQISDLEKLLHAYRTGQILEKE